MQIQIQPESIFEIETAWYIQGIIEEGGMIERISIPSGKFQVGRRADIQLCLRDSSISKLHAEFVTTEQAIFVRDLGSTNGTFVNGKRVSRDTPIGEKDIVRFAGIEFIVGRTDFEHATRTIAGSSEEWEGTFSRFHRLLRERAIIPHFQPIIQFSDHRTIGHEILARSTLAGMSNPKEMFSAAERVSLAAHLSIMCRENGLTAAQTHSVPGLLFLNTHPTELPQTGLQESIEQLRIRFPDLPIVLELHEAAVTNPKEMAEFHRALKDLNILMAYDDFGAGQARLMELSEAAPHFLKFDIGLIRDIHLVPQRQQVVAGLVQIVRDLGIQPLAEGIETPEEADVCRQIGFTHAQGYLYGKPIASHLLNGRNAR